MNDNQMLIFKILSLGESGIGKTCFINRYIDNKYDPCELSTIGIDFKSKIITHEDKKINLKIWDTAGQERFKNLTQQYYRNADGILLMFELTSKDSFTKISYWIEQIKLYSRFGSIPVILIGTKCDLPNHEVKDEEVIELGKMYNMTFFKSSALSNIQVRESFEKLAELMLHSKSRYTEDTEEAKESNTLNLKKIREDKAREEAQRRQNGCCRGGQTKPVQ